VGDAGVVAVLSGNVPYLQIAAGRFRHGQLAGRERQRAVDTAGRGVRPARRPDRWAASTSSRRPSTPRVAP